MENKGTITQIISAVVDVAFKDKLPNIYNALKVKVDDKELVLEVQQHLGNNVIRAVAMDSTDGLQRGMEVIDTGAPIKVPVGKAVLGRILNVLGQPVDDKHMNIYLYIEMLQALRSKKQKLKFSKQESK